MNLNLKLQQRVLTPQNYNDSVQVVGNCKWEVVAKGKIQKNHPKKGVDKRVRS